MVLPVNRSLLRLKQRPLHPLRRASLYHLLLPCHRRQTITSRMILPIYTVRTTTTRSPTEPQNSSKQLLWNKHERKH